MQGVFKVKTGVQKLITFFCLFTFITILLYQLFLPKAVAGVEGYQFKKSDPIFLYVRASLWNEGVTHSQKLSDHHVLSLTSINHPQQNLLHQGESSEQLGTEEMVPAGPKNKLSPCKSKQKTPMLKKSLVSDVLIPVEVD